MGEKRRTSFKLICIFSILLAVFLSIGFSSFVVKGGINENDKITQKDSGLDNSEKVSVNFKYAITSGTMTSYEIEQIGIENVVISDENSYNTFFNTINNDTSDGPKSGTNIAVNEEGYRYSSKDGDYFYILYVHKEIVKTTSTCGSGSYSGQYTIRKQKKPVVEKKTTYFNDMIQESMSFPKGYKLSRNELEDKLYKTDDGNYRLVGVCEQNESDSESYTLLSFPLTIESEKTYFAMFNQKNDSLGYLLGETISEKTSGSFIFNAKAASNEYNVSGDSSYFENDKTVFLGSKSSNVDIDGKQLNATKIAKGVTINFGLNDGSIIKKQAEGSTLDIEPEDGLIQENQYTVCLQSDLYIYGDLVIGSSYGTTRNTYYEGHIAKEFVTFDLNGHNIYLYGKMDSFGLLKDSKGNGNIFIYGGIIHTLAVIYDYRGGSATSSLASSKIFPFQVYSLPYFRCNSKMMYTAEFGWGEITAICACQTTSYSKSEIELNLIGPSSKTELFKLEDGTETSFVEISGYNDEKILKGKALSSNEIKFSLSRRLKWVFSNTKVQLSNLVINPGTKVDTGDFNFPVSSFFDVRLISSSITFSQALKFLPGMSLIADGDSYVIMSYDSSNKRAAQISVLDQGAYYYDSEKQSFVTNDLVSTGSMGFGDTFFSSESLWRYYSGNRIKVYGTIVFRGGNKSIYLLAGSIDFNRIAYSSDGNLDNLDVIAFQDGENPFANLMDKHSDVAIKTFGFDYLLGDNNKNNLIKGYARPLVSYGKGYYTNGSSSNAKVGAYSYRTGIFKISDEEIYYFNSGDSFTLNDNSTCELKACSYDDVTHTFIDSSDNQRYAYFASSYLKYTNTDGTISLNSTRINNKSAQTVNVKYDQKTERWLRV